jgi:hypothetical protein
LESRSSHSHSDFQVDVTEKAAPAIVDHALPRAAAPSAAAIQEHEVGPGTIPEAGFLEVDLVSNGGSSRPFGSRNRCGIHDSDDLIEV